MEFFYLSIKGDFEGNASFVCQFTKVAKGPFFLFDDGRAAVGDDHFGHFLFFAPGELLADGGVAEDLACRGVSSGHRVDDGGTIADVEGGFAQCLVNLRDPSDVGHVKKDEGAANDPVTDSRAADRVPNGKRLERDPSNFFSPPMPKEPPVFDGEVIDQIPGFSSGPHRARGSSSQTPAVVGMGVSQNDVIGFNFVHFFKP